MDRFHISRQSLIRTALLVAVWSAYGLVCACEVHYYYSLSPKPKSWAECLWSEVPYAYLWMLTTPLILWWARRFRLEGRGWPRHILAHAGLLLILGSLTMIGYDLIVRPETSGFNPFTWARLLRSIEIHFDTAALLYSVIVGVEHAFVYYRRYQAGLTKSSQLQTQLVQAQLQALKMQLHPHFLFNTLHSITALVHEDPEMAERTIARLSELLRLFLANSTIHEIPLSEELRILDLYLEIERARFEDRLRVMYDVPSNLRDAMVPNLILQPLVENSIRHGVGRRSEPGWIAVAVERYADTLIVRVTDNGAGFKEDQPVHTGMGLSITRGRLESLYGSHQSLVIRNLPAGGVEARQPMPYHVQTTSTGNEAHAELQSTDRG